MKEVLTIRQAPPMHWVGDGFPVRTLFSYSNLGRELSPFLLLDYAGPADFPPAKTPRGVGTHPHRGFETVTLIYDGEVAHRDSTGEGGVIRRGDVQWMTAGAGILHDEFHSPEFTRTGGRLEMVQLWVNLPARAKLATPRYQALLSEQIPVVDLHAASAAENSPSSAGTARIIAGELDGQVGPANTHTPMQLWDLQLRANTQATLPIPEGWGAGLLVLRGTVRVAGQPRVGAAQLAVFDRPGSDVLLEAESDVVALLISGEPIDEPIVGYGPFVMNTVQQIHEAIADFERGELIRH